MGSVLQHLNAAVVLSWAEHRDLHQKWVRLSVQLSGGDAFVMNDVQQVGNLDLLLRSAEPEMAALWDRGDIAEMGSFISVGTTLVGLSAAWIYSAYEVVRLRRARLAPTPDEQLNALYRRLNLVRIPLAKGEAAFTNKKGGKAGASSRPGLHGNVETGSYIWEVEDHATAQTVKIGRRELADEMLALLKDQPNNGNPG